LPSFKSILLNPMYQQYEADSFNHTHTKIQRSFIQHCQ